MTLCCCCCCWTWLKRIKMEKLLKLIDTPSMHLVFDQTLSVDQDDVLIVVQLIASRHLLIVLDCCGEIAIDGWSDSRLDVDIRQTFPQDRAVGAVIGRLLAFELLTQVREVMTRWGWIETSLIHFLIVHLLMHWRYGIGDGDGYGRCQARRDIVKNYLLISWRWDYWLRLMILVVIRGVCCQFLVQQWCQCWWRWRRW